MDMDFAAEISYLAREPLYKQEKPYSADFEPGSGIKQSNHVYNVTRAKIRNITDPSQFRLDTHGFCILQSPLSMRPEDVLSDHRLIQDAYFAEMEELIHRHFPEYERVDAMSMTVCQVPFSVLQHLKALGPQTRRAVPRRRRKRALFRDTRAAGSHPAQRLFPPRQGRAAGNGVSGSNDPLQGQRLRSHQVRRQGFVAPGSSNE
jgi:hypothetical protein